MIKRLRYVMLISSITVTMTLNSVVMAAPASSNADAQTQQLQVDKGNLQAAQDKRFEIEKNIENLDNQIEDIMFKIEKNKSDIEKVQADIKTTEINIKKSEEDLNNQKKIFNERVKAIYVSGIGAYMETLLDAKGFGDLVSRVEAIKSIIDLDEKIMDKINQQSKKLQADKKELSSKNENLLVINKANTDKLAELTKSKEAQNKLITEAKKQENTFSAIVAGSEAKIKETMAQVVAVRAAVPQYIPTRGATTISSNAVIAFASNFLGTPYLWGGTTPAGFDCSGFTQYVYAHFGVRLGRTTYDQIKDGVAVSKDNLQPGDLLFYGNGSPTHMGMYIGNGMYIHAPRTGDVIKISPIARPDYITARRVM